MQSLPVSLFLVAFLTICSGAPSFNYVGRPRFFLREAKRTAGKVDIEACLKAHNQLRAKHDAPSLSWDEKLAEHAQSWANDLVKLGKMKHATKTGEGENLYWSASTSKVATCVDAVKAWASEEKDYPVDHPPQTFAEFANNGHPIGHYTQEVWKATKTVGVAIATKNDGKFINTYIVARYSPAGNVLNEFEKNVE